MPFCKLVGFFVALSIASTAGAQTAATKPKPAKKPPVAGKPAKPVEKASEPAIPPPPPPPPATDVKIRTKYVNGAVVSENTTYMKGVRQRFEFPGMTLITQCDLKRSLQVHDATKHFMVVPTETPVAPPSAGQNIPSPSDPRTAPEIPGMPTMNGGAAPSKPRGGVITETTTLADTGGRKQLFGLEARHIKTVYVRQPGPNACDLKSIRIETDGWYADIPEHAACPAVSPAPPAPAGQQACTDRIETQQVGTAKLGFAVSTAVTTTVDDGKDKDVTTMMVEVTDLQVTSLEPALFDVPADYTEVTSHAALLPGLAGGGSLADAVFGSLSDGSSTIAPKQPGVIRIGIIDPTNKTGRTLSMPVLRSGLIATLSKKPFEALQVAGATPADLDRDATGKACDYILVSDIAELKTSKPNKVGGMLKKVSGDTNAPTEMHDARVDYKLYAVGDQAKPKVTASVKASSGGGFGLGSALKIAAFAGSMYMTMGMGSGMMMNMMGPYSALGGLGGMGGGPMSALMNPGMGAAMSMLSQAQMMGGAGMMGMPGMSELGDSSAQKAMQTVQDALSKAGKQVAEELKTGKLAAIGTKK